MTDEPAQPSVADPHHYSASANAFKTLADKVYIHEVPSYGNKIYYGLGFLALTSLALLIVTCPGSDLIGQFG